MDTVSSDRFNGKSLTGRLILSVTILNLGFWVVACILAAFVMLEEYGETFDGTLKVTAERLLPLVLSDVRQNQGHDSLLVRSDSKSNTEEYTTYQILDRAGNLVMRSEGAPASPYGVPLVTGFASTRYWRVYSMVSQSGDYIIQIADRLSERHEAAREAMTAMFVPALLLIPLNIIIVGLVLRRQLAFVGHFGERIAEKNTGNMDKIDGSDVRSEFQPIVTAVNSLLERLKAALDAEKTFTANSAHEIRTPIAAALAHTQVLQEQLPKRYLDRVKEVEASLQRLRRLSEKLLQLARADARVGISEQQIDLIPYVLAVLEDFTRTGVTMHRLSVAMETPTLIRMISGDALAIIMRNLIENALHYSPADTQIHVVLNTNRIIVNNDCIVVPAERLEKLSNRFYRNDDTVEGFGLGLSIVNALAVSMGISVTYTSPISGTDRGFSATINL